jgi:hypothetical protein
MPETLGSFALDRNHRQTIQQCIDRLQTPCSLTLRQRFQLSQCHGIRQIKVTDDGSAQSTQMSATTQRLTNIGRQNTNVSSLAAGNTKGQAIARKVEGIDGVNRDCTRLPLNLDTFSASSYNGRPLRLSAECMGGTC